MITKHFKHHNRDIYFILNNEKDEYYLKHDLEEMRFPLNFETVYIVESPNYFIAYQIQGELYWSFPFDEDQCAIQQIEGFLDIEGHVINQQLRLKYRFSFNRYETTFIYLLDELCDIEVNSGPYVRIGPLLVIEASKKNQIIECKWNTSKLIDIYSKGLLIPLSFHLRDFKLSISKPLFSNYERGIDYEKLVIYLSNTSKDLYIEYKEMEIQNFVSVISNDDWMIDIEVEKIIHFYEKKFGSLKRLTIISHDSIAANAISYLYIIVVKPIITQHMTNFLFEYLPHEVGHQWFGIHTIFTGMNAYKMTEGLVEYLQLLYLKDRFGDNIFYKRRSWYEIQFHHDHPVRKDLSRYVLKWDNLYHNLGDSLFYTLLKDILKYKEFNCEDLEYRMNSISENKSDF